MRDGPGSKRIAPLSKAEAAYREVLQGIRSGALEPGERLTLQQLSTSLGMSLTPVREALNTLVAEGFVQHERHRGTFVAEFSERRVNQIYRLRSVLEPLATQLVADRVNSQDLAREVQQLESLLATCDTAESAMDVVLSNEAFHRGLYRLSNDELLVDFIDKLWAGVPYQSLSLYGSGDRIQQSSCEHHAVLQAVTSGDGEAAAALMREHIQNGRAAAFENM